MKKIVMMLAVAASVMAVSCGKGDGKTAGSADSATATEQTEQTGQTEQAIPQEMECKLSSTSGDFSTVAPSLGVVKLTFGAPEADQVPVEAEVTMEVKEADPAVKTLKSYKVVLGYRTEADERKEVPAFDIDPAQADKLVTLLAKGAQGDKDIFKFTGKISKADVEGLKTAKRYFMYNTNMVWGK